MTTHREQNKPMEPFSNEPDKLREILSKPHIRRSVTRALLCVFVAIEDHELWQDLWRLAFSDIFAELEEFKKFCLSLPNPSESVDDEQEGEKLNMLAKCFQKTDIFSVMDFYGISEDEFFHKLDSETRNAFTKIVDERIDSYKEAIISKDFSEESMVRDTPMPFALFSGGGPSDLDVVDRFALASCLKLPSDILKIYCMDMDTV